MWRRLVGTVAVGGLVAGAMFVAVRPALSAPGFAPHGVLLTDSDLGDALFGGGPLAPGERRKACTTVTNSGGGSGDVRLYGATSGTGLDRFLDVTVARGILSRDSAPGSCRGFQAQVVLFTGRLRAFPSSYDDAITDPYVSWSPGESHAYRITVTLRDHLAAQGLTASQSFVWEGRTP